MSFKIKTLHLQTYEQLNPDSTTPGQMRRVWVVEKATDSIEFSPGRTLLKPQVEELCASKEWKVTITQPKG